MTARASGAAPGPMRRRPALLVTAGVLTVLGSAALTAAIVVPQGADRSSAPVLATSAAPSVEPTPARTPSAGPASAALTPLGDLADREWIERVAAAGDIPPRALAAYAGAAIEVARTRPDCGLGWNTLAAIGHVESEHGTLGGSRIGSDGVAAPAVVGIALDGTSTDAIRDSDQGRLDGDPVWDRAVGPMQFLPATWAVAAQDGDRDGRTDVHQIDDAALTAAVHLCESGGDVSDPAGWIAAVGAYNSSLEYNNRVAASAEHYASLR